MNCDMMNDRKSVFILLILFSLSWSSTAQSIDTALDDVPLDADVDLYLYNQQLSVDGNDPGENFDQSGMDAENDKRVVTAIDKSLAAIYAIITVVGLLFNGVVFFVIFGRNEISRTVTAMYVVQLALADSAFLLSLPIFGMQKIIGSWTFGSATCTICQTIKFLNYYAGIFFLTAMSVDRYIAVAYSTTANQLRTKKRTVVVCAIVWILSAVMSLPIAVFAKTEDVLGSIFCRLLLPGYPVINETDSYFYYSGLDVIDVSIDNETLEDYENYTVPAGFESSDQMGDIEPIYETRTVDGAFNCMHGRNYTSYKSWLIVNFVIGFLIPFLVISISYFLILKRIRTSKGKLGNKGGKRTAIVRKRVTRTVAALVICFVICWLPYHIFLMAKIEGFKVSVPTCTGIEQFFVALGFSNSALNPILYTFMGHNFMGRLRESISITKRRLRRGSMASMAGHLTRSHSDHGNTTFARKFSNIVGLRRASRVPTAHEVDCPNDQSAKQQQGKRLKSRIPLLNLQKRKANKSGWNCEAKQKDRSECMSGIQSNQTEWTRVMLDKDIKNDDHDIFVEY